MRRCLGLFLCLPLLAATACAADAIAGREPEAGAAAQAGVQEPAAAPQPPHPVLLRSPRPVSSFAHGTDPLFIVDGVPWTGSPDSLSTFDIESVEVVRGATLSAIYGNRRITDLVIIRTRGATGLRAAAQPVAGGDARH